MKKRIIKLIVCIMLISALMIGFCTAYASAATPVWLLRAKAGIAAALMAANIVFEPIGALEHQSLANAIDPLGIVETINDTAWTDYIDQSVIVVRPDKVTIDGVPYSEIWLGSNAVNSLRASGFDFKTAYNLLANQSQAVSYADGYGYAGLNEIVPLYLRPGNTLTSPLYIVNYGTTDLGDIDVVISDNSSTSSTNKITVNFVSPYETPSSKDIQKFNYSYVGDYGAQYYGSYGVSTCTLRAGFLASPTSIASQSNLWNSTTNIPVDSDPFEFDYTSGVIDTEPIDPEDGLLLRVPSSYNDGQQGSVYNYDIHDLVNIYPQVNDTNGHELVFDPNLNPDFDVDLDMGNALGDIITAVILAKLADLLGDDAETIYAPMPDKPDPDPQPGVIDPLPDPDPAPDDPIPGTTIANTDWTKLDEILRWIQSTIDSIRHLTESLQTMLDSIFDAIQSAIQHIAEIPEAIRELADRILEDIELGPSKLFDKALDILKTLFLPLLLPIRAMMNLWHYVVEWIQSVSNPFSWIFGIMSSTSYNMVLPIYALLAGGICISIYKALGR